MAWYKRTYQTLVNLAQGFQLGGATVSASAAELNLIDGSVAGTAVASKAAVLGANKNLDVLAVADLKLGAGAGTSVTSTAAELNLLDGSVAGTAVASKALALGANKNVDVLAVADLKLGADAGTSVTKTAAEINDLVGGASGGYMVARGVSAVTGTADVATGLTTVVAVLATAQDDLDGDTLAGVSATVGDQAGTPAAGSVTLKCWKNDADGDATMVAATAEKNVNWVAIGT